jgi:hypothetical protein
MSDAATSPNPAVYQLRVVMVGISPLIWRRLRPKLAGLTDHECLWEPVAGCWNVRPRAGDTQAPGTGPFTVDFA